MVFLIDYIYNFFFYLTMRSINTLKDEIMVDVLNINELTDHIKPIVNRGRHTTEDEVSTRFARSASAISRTRIFILAASTATPAGSATPPETSWYRLLRDD